MAILPTTQDFPNAKQGESVYYGGGKYLRDGDSFRAIPQDPSESFTSNQVYASPLVKSPTVISAKAAQDDFSSIQSQHQDIVTGMTNQSARLAAEKTAADQAASQKAAADAEAARKQQETDAKTAAIGAEGTAPAKTPEQLALDENRKALQDTQEAYQAQAKQVQDTITNIQNGTIPLSAGEQAQVDALKQAFQQLISDQALINTGASGSANIRGYQKGAAEYDPSFQIKTIGSIVNAGQQKILDLNVKMASAVASLTQSFKDQNIKAAKAAWDLYSEASRARTDALRDTINETTAAIKDARDFAYQAEKDQMATMEKENERIRVLNSEAGVINAMAEGINDPLQILTRLRKSGVEATSKDVAEAIKNFRAAEKDTPGIVGEWIAAKENDPSLKDISLQEYMDLKDPGRSLELEYKRAQIKKIEKELADVGSTEDAANILAYAQQYASTGAIPTGLPKGTFGVVAQAAKELPKAPSTIVNKITGVADSKAPAGEQADYAKLYNILNNVKRLKELDAKRIGGSIGGRLGALFGENDQVAYLATRKAIVDDMARMQSGAALTPEEIKNYEEYLPGPYSDTPGFSNWLFKDSLQQIQAFENIINNRLRERLDTNNLSMYGYSKVKLGDKEYTVGDTVTNAQGQVGTLLPDGSVAIQDTGQDFNSVGGDTNPASLETLKTSIIESESGGDYSAIGLETDAGRALGKYQMIPANLKLVGLDGNNPSDRQKYLRSPQLQDLAFSRLLDELEARYKGDVRKVAADYYGGPDAARIVGTSAANKKQVAYVVKNGIKKKVEMPSINEYVRKVTNT